MNTCRSLSRSYSQPYAREGLKQGHKSNTDSWGTKYPFQGVRSIGKLRRTPVAGREKLPPNKAGKQRPGRSYLDPTIPRGRNSPLEHNPFIILCRDSLKAAMRVEYCVVHSQVAFVIQDATCAINHPSRIVRVDVKGQVPQSSSQATAEAAKAKARAIRRGKSMPRAHRAPRYASASCYT